MRERVCLRLGPVSNAPPCSKVELRLAGSCISTALMILDQRQRLDACRPTLVRTGSAGNTLRAKLERQQPCRSAVQESHFSSSSPNPRGPTFCSPSSTSCRTESVVLAGRPLRESNIRASGQTPDLLTVRRSTRELRLPRRSSSSRTGL